MTGPNILSIDGVQLPAPMTYSVEYSDLDSDDTGRSEDGLLHRVRIRAGVAKIKVSWEQLDTATLDSILNAIAPESLSVTYYFGVQKTATMYASAQSCDVRRINGGKAKWNLSFNLIEF